MQVFDEDPSVAQAVQQQTEPVSLEQCLQAFTREEQLSGDEKYYCPKCATHQPATKKLQIWRLPPILIVHLKRFQFVNHRWIKSHKAVQFPHVNLDLADYLAAIPSQTLVRHRQMATDPAVVMNGVPEVDDQEEHRHKDEGPGTEPISNGHHLKVNGDGDVDSEDGSTTSSSESTRKRLESTSLMTNPVKDEDLLDFHQHRLLPGYNKLDITYSLYAAVVSSTLLRVPSFSESSFKYCGSLSPVPFRNHGRRPLHLLRQESKWKMVLLQRFHLQGTFHIFIYLSVLISFIIF